MRALRRLRRPRGRLPSLGHDFDRGHREYVSQLDPGAELWLRTKPFKVPPNEELPRCLHTFANLVEHLDLPLRAQVLDLACGPGWLAEMLVRCGYWTTGIDVSEDMIRIARERIDSIPRPIAVGIDPAAEFHALPVLQIDWEARFDAVILYDAMHHLDDELETLHVIRRALVPGGVLYIDEGARPEPGSAGERQLIEEMHRYGTLESPFDIDYLLSVLREAGFTEVRRLFEVNQLVDLSQKRAALRSLSSHLRRPITNVVMCVNPLPPGLANAPPLAGRVTVAADFREEGEDMVATLLVRNVGRRYWPSAAEHAPKTVVTVGLYVLAANGERIELPRAHLPRSLSSGQEAEVEVRLPREALAPQAEVAIDLVFEEVGWFSEPESPPLRLNVP